MRATRVSDHSVFSQKFASSHTLRRLGVCLIISAWSQNIQNVVKSAKTQPRSAVNYTKITYRPGALLWLDFLCFLKAIQIIGHCQSVASHLKMAKAASSWLKFCLKDCESAIFRIFNHVWYVLDICYWRNLFQKLGWPPRMPTVVRNILIAFQTHKNSWHHNLDLFWIWSFLLLVGVVMVQDKLLQIKLEDLAWYAALAVCTKKF